MALRFSATVRACLRAQSMLHDFVFCGLVGGIIFPHTAHRRLIMASSSLAVFPHLPVGLPDQEDLPRVRRAANRAPEFPSQFFISHLRIERRKINRHTLRKRYTRRRVTMIAVANGIELAAAFDKI
jgi:hypothetical protein